MVNFTISTRASCHNKLISTSELFIITHTFENHVKASHSYMATLLIILKIGTIQQVITHQIEHISFHPLLLKIEYNDTANWFIKPINLKFHHLPLLSLYGSMAQGFPRHYFSNNKRIYISTYIFFLTIIDVWKNVSIYLVRFDKCMPS